MGPGPIDDPRKNAFFHQAEVSIIDSGADAGMVKVEINKPFAGRSRVIYYEEKWVVAALIASQVGGKSMKEAQSENLFIEQRK